MKSLNTYITESQRELTPEQKEYDDAIRNMHAADWLFHIILLWCSNINDGKSSEGFVKGLKGIIEGPNSASSDDVKSLAGEILSGVESSSENDEVLSILKKYEPKVQKLHTEWTGKFEKAQKKILNVK